MGSVMDSSERFVTLKIRREIINEIDRIISSLKDEFGLPIFRGRSTFVEQACRHYIKHVKKGLEQAKGGQVVTQEVTVEHA
jgi:metal-responsive CopG/Arc/MetJ family transcriptional regulator